MPPLPLPISPGALLASTYISANLLFDSINTIEEENLIACDKADRFIYEWILNKDNLSYTNDSIKNVENYYRFALLKVNLTSMNIDELDKSTRLYVHILEDQKELNECFNPIFDFIYDMMLYKLYEFFLPDIRVHF